MVYIGICDDNWHALQSIKTEVEAVLAKSNMEFQIVCYTSGHELLGDMESQEPLDLLLIDIDMPGLNGLQVAKAVRQSAEETILIFVTAHSEYVFEAIEYAPFRYIRKSRLKLELEKALQDACHRLLANAKDFYVIKAANGEVKLLYSHILYVETMGQRLRFNIKSGQEILSKTGLRMKDSIVQLREHHFVQIHSGCAVNVRHITQYTKTEVMVEGGYCFPVSRRRMPMVHGAIIDYWKRQV